MGSPGRDRLEIWDIARRQRLKEIRPAPASRLRFASDGKQIVAGHQCSGLGLWDVATGRVHWDERLEEIYGFAPGTFPGTYDAWFATLHPDDADRVLGSVQQAVALASRNTMEHRIIQTNGKAQFRLVGHTDTIGDDFSNQKLSEARARAVKDWLTGSLKLDGSHIVVEGRGEREPIPGVNPRGDAAAQQLNRRVEIHKTGG